MHVVDNWARREVELLIAEDRAAREREEVARARLDAFIEKHSLDMVNNGNGVTYFHASRGACKVPAWLAQEDLRLLRAWLQSKGLKR